MKIIYNRFSSKTTATASLIVATMAATTLSLHAGSYSWQSSESGGDWSTSANWTPDTGTPGKDDSAALGNAEADRRIIYDTLTSGTLTTLTFGQTSAFNNVLEIKKDLTVLNALTLGATGGGTAEIFVAPPVGVGSSTYRTFRVENGLTIDSGGVLGFATTSANNNGRTQLTGNIDLNGGVIRLNHGTDDRGSAAFGVINGRLTMTGGTLELREYDSTLSRYFDNRLNIAGVFNATGGTISTGGNGQAINFTKANTTATIGAGVTLVGDTAFSLQADGVSLSLDATGAGGILARVGSNTTVTQRLGASDSTATAEIGNLSLGTSANSRINLYLDSNVKTTSASGKSLTQSYGAGAGGTATLELNLNGYTFDGTSTGTVWTPDHGTSTTSEWNIESEKTGGVFKMVGINTNTSGIVSNFGKNVTVQVTGSNNATINLRGEGSFHVDSKVLYTGNASASNAAVLSTDRVIPNFTISQGHVQANTDVAAGSTIYIGDANTVGGDATKAYAGLKLNTAVMSSDIVMWNVETGTGQASISAVQNSAINGKVSLAAGSNVRSQFNAAAGVTLTFNGAVETNGTSPRVMLEGSVTDGTFLFNNASNDFSGVTLGMTLTKGTLISGTNGALGNLNSIILANAAISEATAADHQVSLLARGENNTVSSAISLGNAGGDTLAGSYVLGGDDASDVRFSGDIVSAAYSDSVVGDRNLIVTASAGGSVRFMGQISEATSGDGQKSSMMLEKTGAGTVTLGGNNQYSGRTLVSAGTLLINGDQSAATGAVTVAAGAKLGGSGTLGGIVAVNGELAPSNSAESLAVEGLTITSSGTLAIELGHSDSLLRNSSVEVANGVSLESGANLKLTLDVGLDTAEQGDIFWLVINNGESAVDGVFTSLNGISTDLSEGSTFGWSDLQWQITYGANFGSASFTDGNSIALQVIPEPSAFILAGIGLGAVALLRRKRPMGGL